MVTKHAAQMRERRKALRTRLGGRCAQCGQSAGLEFHHWPIERYRRGYCNTDVATLEAEAALKGLVLLCHSCHRQIPPKGRRYQKNRIRKRREWFQRHVRDGLSASQTDAVAS